MEIGARIYYDKLNGNVIVNTGERSGDVIETTVEQDFEAYTDLSGRTVESVGMVQLKFGEYSSDYAEGGVITRVDLATLKPLFTYSSQTENPSEPQKPLSEEIKEVKERQNIMQDALDALLMGGM